MAVGIQDRVRDLEEIRSKSWLGKVGEAKVGRNSFKSGVMDDSYVEDNLS